MSCGNALLEVQVAHRGLREEEDRSLRRVRRRLRELAPRYDCKRSFDTAPVPAVWVCDEMSRGLYPTPMEKAAETLSKLKSKKGRRFFASPEFRSTLDGDIAEQYLSKSEAAAKKAKQP
jgi:hypothetical protein